MAASTSVMIARQTIVQLDRQATARMGFNLMAAAGAGIACFLLQRHGQKNKSGNKPVFGFICGKGNNGGDGMVAASCLAKAGHLVRVFLLGPVSQLQGDAEKALALLRGVKGSEIKIVRPEKFPWASLQACDVWVDAIFGTGLVKKAGKRPPVFDFICAVQKKFARQKKKILIAIDLPSGLDADTGVPLYGEKFCLRASETLTLGFAKPGLMGDPGYFFSGEVTVIPLPYPKNLLKHLPNHHQWIDGEAQKIAPRPKTAHKGNFGHCVIVGGSAQMPGALQLCVQAALTSGAGKVSVFVPGRFVKSQLLKNCSEAMWHSVEADVEGFFSTESLLESLRKIEAVVTSTKFSSVVIGPGMGCLHATWKWLEGLFDLQKTHQFPMVVDADALNAWAAFSQTRLEKSKAPVIATPHVAELARLLRTTTANVAGNRFVSVTKATRSLGAWVILKGFRSLLAGVSDSPVANEVFVDINASGNPGMAKPGMGDVLSGILGARLAMVNQANCTDAQWRQTAQTSLFVHGRSGDLAVASWGEESLRAGHMINFLPKALTAQKG